MQKFNIEKPNQDIVPQLIDKINNLTKPKGSLGRLEELAVRIRAPIREEREAMTAKISSKSTLSERTTPIILEPVTGMQGVG